MKTHCAKCGNRYSANEGVCQNCFQARPGFTDAAPKTGKKISPTVGCITFLFAAVGLIVFLQSISDHDNSIPSDLQDSHSSESRPSYTNPRKNTPAQNLTIIDSRPGEVAKYQALLTKLSGCTGESEKKLADSAAGVHNSAGGTCYESLQALEVVYCK